jgi:hypothetical protein
MQDFNSKVLQGLMVISTTDFEIIPFILTGRYDECLKCALFSVNYRRAPANVEELESAAVLMGLERIKDRFRKLVQEIFDLAAEQDRQELMASLRKTNQPHEMGTVAEIAAKYNISKSEVRRMKQAGTLESLQMLEV